MLYRLLLTAMAVSLTATLGYSDQTRNTVVIPVHRTAPNNGHQMYSSYCAPCHGVDGRGQGQIASALKTRPTDLTLLSKNNRGRFPDTHIVTVLEFGIGNPAHRIAEMPAWGPILGKMNEPQDRLLRIRNLSSYLDSIQVR
jgi:mono/diheme cytochrome c family protein